MSRTLTEEQRVLARVRQRRYRETHREHVRADGRAYQERKRREAGVRVQGSPESNAHRSAARKLSGPDHPRWKGDAVGYLALHAWVSRHKKRTGICAHCGDAPKPKSSFRKVGTEWANVSREYKRDLDDWIELCKPCHVRFDRV